jgi:hypothetical protein
MITIAGIVNNWAREEKAQMLVDDVPEVSRKRLIERLEAYVESIIDDTYVPEPKPLKSNVQSAQTMLINNEMTEAKNEKDMRDLMDQLDANIASVKFNKDGSTRKKPSRKPK